MLSMGRNAKGSPWVSTPQELRKRKQIVVMLSDSARAKLARLVAARGKGMRSTIVEELIEAAPEGKKP